MSRTEKEAIAICLDVGKNSSAASGGKTFLERAVDCVKKIITRKIFAKPADEIGVILFGCDETSNDLNSQGLGYENIVEMDNLKMSSWSMLEALDKVKQGSSSVGWTESLLVAINYLSNETQAKKFSHLRIILFTNFLTSTDDNNLDVIAQNISNLEIELIGVSDSLRQDDENTEMWTFTQNPDKESNQRESERVFEKMTEEIEKATLCHIDYVESQLVYFQKKTTRGMPWNVDLKIGSELSIKVSAYVYIQSAPLVSFKTECIESNTVTKMVTDYMRNNEIIEKPNEDEIVKAYFYGSKLIPCDEADVFYDSGDKCLDCYAFCKRSQCDSNLFAGKGCHIVVPQKDSPKSEQMFASLVENMLQKDCFMVARKVYRKGTKPLVVNLFPKRDENGMCLVMIEMPYADDIHRNRYEKFRVLKSAKPSDEQMEAMRNLVDAMDLTNAIDDDSGVHEAFTIENSLNPFHQHICRTVAHRAVNPNQPLPTFNDELKKMIDVPEKIKKQSEQAVKEVERLFPLEIIHHQEKSVFGQKSAETQAAASMDAMETDLMDTSNERHIIAVGTVTPAEDFLYLVDKKTERFVTLCEQIEGIIYELIFKSATNFDDKIKSSIMAYRETAKVNGPFNYNNWIQELKKMMIKKNKIEEWNKYVVKEGLGLITINESPISTVTLEENLEFYEIVSKDATADFSTSVHPEDDELENLL